MSQIWNHFTLWYSVILNIKGDFNQKCSFSLFSDLSYYVQFIFKCKYVYIYIYTYKYIYMYIYVCVCVYIYMFSLCI